jgi:hypothetical protein
MGEILPSLSATQQRILLKLRNVELAHAGALLPIADRRQSHRFSVAVYDSLRYDLWRTDTISGKRGTAVRRNGNGRELHYSAVNRSDVPQGRKGKHRKVVSHILGDLLKLNHEEAVKIPLSSLGGEKMQNLRSALNRATRDKKIPVVTSSDDKYLYVWRADISKNAGTNE